MDSCFYVIAWTPRPLEFFRFRYVPLIPHVLQAHFIEAPDILILRQYCRVSFIRGPSWLDWWILLLYFVDLLKVAASGITTIYYTNFIKNVTSAIKVRWKLFINYSVGWTTLNAWSTSQSRVQMYSATSLIPIRPWRNHRGRTLDSLTYTVCQIFKSWFMVLFLIWEDCYDPRTLLRHIYRRKKLTVAW